MIWQMVLSKVTGTRSFKFSNSSNAPSILFETVIKECLREYVELFNDVHFSSLCAPFRAGFLPQNVPLQLISYLPQEKEFLPWHASSRALYQLDKLLDRTEDYSLFSVGESSPREPSADAPVTTAPLSKGGVVTAMFPKGA